MNKGVVLGFVVRRLAAMIGVLLLLVAIMLVLRSVSPIDAGRVALGPQASDKAVDAYNEGAGLNDPLPEQYVDYISDVVGGDFGESVRTQRPIADDLNAFLPATIELAFFAFFLAIIFGLLLGIVSARRTIGARITRLSMIALASAPSFLLAFALLLLLGNELDWFPISGRTDYSDAPGDPTGLLLIDSLIAGRPEVFFDTLWHLILPAIAIAALPAVAMGRILRGSLIEVYQENYIRTARSKGLQERTVLYRHALRNAIGPALAVAGLQAGLMLAGVVIVEQIFGWPGIGTYVGESIPANDYPAIIAVTLVLGAAYVLINALVDLFQAWGNPRLILER